MTEQVPSKKLRRWHLEVHGRDDWVLVERIDDKTLGPGMLSGYRDVCLWSEAKAEIERLNAELAYIRRRTGFWGEVPKESVFADVAHAIYCDLGKCRDDPKCFYGASQDVRDEWVEAVRKALSKYSAQPPGDGQ